MSFRARIAVAAAAAVALAVVLASVLVFFVVRDQLRGQIDDTLEQQAAKIAPIRWVGRGRPEASLSSPSGPGSASRTRSSSSCARTERPCRRSRGRASDRAPRDRARARRGARRALLLRGDGRGRPRTGADVRLRPRLRRPDRALAHRGRRHARADPSVPPPHHGWWDHPGRGARAPRLGSRARPGGS